MTEYLFDLYIHTNKMNYIPAKVGEYSFKKYNKNLPVYLQFVENCEYLKKFNNRKFRRSRKNVQYLWNINKSQSFFPVRFMCCEEHKKMKRNNKWILIIDPDIFCLKSIIDLNKYILEAEKNDIHIIACENTANFLYKEGNKNIFNSCFMLVNTEYINWTEKNIVNNVFIKNEDFDNYMLLKKYNVLKIPNIYNSIDRILSDTIVLHTTKTHTQPWKTGIKYYPSDLHNQIKKKNEKKSKIFKEHIDKKVKETVFNFFKLAYENNYYTKENIMYSIWLEALRPDIKKICNIP